MFLVPNSTNARLLLGGTPWVRVAGGFSPLSLFAGGTQGAWFDPSDISTLFQDSNGATPVTASGQPVGLMLDKSKGLVQGDELVVDDNQFTLSSATISNLTITATSTSFNTFATFPQFAVGKYYKVSFDYAKSSGGNLTFRFNSVFFSINSGSGTFSAVLPSSAGDPGLVFRSESSGWSGVISNISVREFPGNHAIQATSSKRPTYTEGSGLSWLAFDGVDDTMKAASVDFTGTDKVSLFSGVRRIDATARIITELSANAANNSGAFYLVSGTDVGFTAYSSISRGSVNPGVSGIAGFSDSTNPSTDVVSVTHDIAGDLSTMRTNGVARTSGTGDKGAGNFGNYTLYIGSRNQITLYFKGNLYGLIIPGKLASAAEIASTEAYLAAKTGVTL